MYILSTLSCKLTLLSAATVICVVVIIVAPFVGFDVYDVGSRVNGLSRVLRGTRRTIGLRSVQLHCEPVVADAVEPS